MSVLIKSIDDILQLPKEYHEEFLNDLKELMIIAIDAREKGKTWNNDFYFTPDGLSDNYIVFDS